ncbi:hypothetical protein ACS0PU_012187 [Formica fusca]
MRRFAIVMLGLISLVSAKPALLSVPLTYVTPLTPVGPNRGQTLDKPKDPVAHLDERRTNSANEAGGSIGPREQESSSRFVNDGAPLGVDGRVVDTPEVAAAKAAHAAAHVKEKINLANEAARSGSATDLSETNDDVTLTETILNTPKVTRVNEKINLEGDVLARLRDGSVVPLVLGNGVVALVPVGLDGRPLDNVPETVVARDDQNPANNARSVDALAIAGPALAYGRLIY